MAINPVITAPSSAIGRVTGFLSDTSIQLTNNYAWAGINISGAGYTADNGHDKKDGVNFSAAEAITSAWWIAPSTYGWYAGGSAFVWDFDFIWINTNGRLLPTLKNVCGNQNPAFP